MVGSRMKSGREFQTVGPATDRYIVLQRESATKFSLCKNHYQQSCKALIGLSIRAKMVGGGHPLTRPLQKRRFPVLQYLLVAPQP